jgi:hypothetical protein
MMKATRYRYNTVQIKERGGVPEAVELIGVLYRYHRYHVSVCGVMSTRTVVCVVCWEPSRHLLVTVHARRRLVTPRFVTVRSTVD